MTGIKKLLAHVFGNGPRRVTGTRSGSAIAGVPQSLPALSRAVKLGDRASRAGFDWPDRGGVRDKIFEELEELEAAIGLADAGNIEEEMGDLLFSIVNMARHLNIDPEKALSRANAKFERRFRSLESQIKDSGKRIADLDLESLDEHWLAAKKSVG